MQHFSCLEPDKKTFEIIQSYMEIIQKHQEFNDFDMKLQIKEIQDHNYRHCKDESLQWIDQFAYGYRLYLNTIKEIALIFIATERECNWDNFVFFVEKINKNQELLGNII